MNDGKIDETRIWVAPNKGQNRLKIMLDRRRNPIPIASGLASILLLLLLRVTMASKLTKWITPIPTEEKEETRINVGSRHEGGRRDP